MYVKYRKYMKENKTLLRYYMYYSLAWPLYPCFKFGSEFKSILQFEGVLLGIKKDLQMCIC